LGEVDVFMLADVPASRRKGKGWWRNPGFLNLDSSVVPYTDFPDYDVFEVSELGAEAFPDGRIGFVSCCMARVISASLPIR
jgi:hypothetical protein